jgi:hypothetical protein
VTCSKAMRGASDGRKNSVGGWLPLGGVFLALILIPSDYQLNTAPREGGALCQSLLCFKKQPLILKQLIF